MAHGLGSVIKRSNVIVHHNCTNSSAKPEGKTGIGSRRIFSPHFKLQVLDSYRNDSDCKGNQRATARKYGIHRRQIQKWLQVEENLRSSVNNSAKGDNGNHNNTRSTTTVSLNASRQLDTTHTSASVGSLETAVSYWSTGSPSCPVRPFAAALDYSTSGSNSCSPLASPDPASPIDLSFKKADRVTPVLAPCLTPPQLSVVHDHVFVPCVRETEREICRLPVSQDVWDLSTKNLKRKYDDDDGETSTKPVKLFQPYLDILRNDNSNNNNSNAEEKPSIVFSHITPPPCCYQGTSVFDNHYNNLYSNNNNICCTSNESYTLHELQPNNYCCPPTIPDYDVRSYCDISYATSSLKQRQSYSLDFKLSAIDSFYQDSVCKGNQRAVASKYNIHRRQVQKWLKQADELKLKNETHSVR